MSGPWHCERDDLEGVYVYDARDTPGYAMGGDMSGHETELAAWEHGLDALVDRRDRLASSIKHARAEIRRLKRPKTEKGRGRCAPD